ncbi:DUF222 domain-containing protein [Mycobacterium sp. SMC-4]|nr:DUF222 domain-containing protein [Mycobacterium sp. SMC-4]
MCEGGLPGGAELGSLSAAGLIDAARACARAENIAASRKLAVMAELFDRRTQLPCAEDRSNWWVDPDAAVAAELGAALGVNQWLALTQTQRAVALRDRLPRVAALFAQGLISDMLVRTILTRTELITDPQALAAVDDALARQVGFWSALSRTKIEQAIDATVIACDPAAQRTATDTAGRSLDFGYPTDPAGLVSLQARMHAHDAAALYDRITTIAATVCPADPRTSDQRRYDALAAISYGLDTLACTCSLPDCDAATARPPTPNTTVYLITDATCSTQPATADPPDAGTPTPTETAELASAPEAPAPAPAPAPAASAPGSAFLFGRGVLPPALVAPMLANARIREIVHPGQRPAESRYLPSPALAEFVCCRDLTCRFPNCEVPATHADIDHTVPYPLGPTHASNLKCLCRFHHLLKTFWVGPDGWSERQHPDGTIEWTSPTGHTYTTKPGSSLLFPALCRPTATLWVNGPPPTPTPTPRRGTMMPRRRYTRAQAHARYITALRKTNTGVDPHREHPPNAIGTPPF